MGKIDTGILGGFKGKVGTVVGGKWRGVEYMRSKGPSKRKNNSPAQLEQQAKFALAVSFVRNMSDLFKITFKNYAQQMTARNKALAGTITKAITGVYPDFTIDYSQVLISRGGLKVELSPTLSVTGGTINWQWTFNGNQNGANPKDRTIVVVYCPDFEHCLYQVYGPTRESNGASLDVSPFSGHTVFTWLAFISEDGSKISKSLFTGQVAVE